MDQFYEKMLEFVLDGEEDEAVELTRAQIEEILTALDSGKYGQILRAKGIVKGEEGWLEFDFVPEEHNLRDGRPDYTGRLCVIGAELDEDGLKSFQLPQL